MPLENENAVGFWAQMSQLEYDGVEEYCNAPGCCFKGFWAIVLLLSLIPLYYYDNEIYNSFTAKTSVTSIDEIREDKLEFPNVTLCVKSRFNNTFIKTNIQLPNGWQQWGVNQNDLLDDFAAYIQALAYQSVSFDVKTNGYMAKIYDFNFNKSVNSKAIDVKAWLNDAALQCDVLLSSCLFLLKSFNCCDNAVPVLSDYGICWQIKIQSRDNRSSQAYQTMAGTSMGAIIVTASNLSDVQAKDEFDFRLHIGDTLNPVDIDVNSVLIPPRQQAVVRMDPVQYVSDPNVISCVEDPVPLAYHSQYNQGLCQNECLLNVSLRQCGCGALGYGANLPSDKVCSPLQMQKCFLPLRQQQSLSTNQEIAQCVAVTCLEMCTSGMSYQPYVTFTGLKSLTEDESFFIQMEIYFGDIKYTSVQSQLLLDVNGLLMGIGGVVGLWTGVSVITVVQFFAYIACYHLYRDAEKRGIKNEKPRENQKESLNETAI